MTIRTGLEDGHDRDRSDWVQFWGRRYRHEPVIPRPVLERPELTARRACGCLSDPIVFGHQSTCWTQQPDA